MSHRESHHCPACNRPNQGLTADQIFDAMTRRMAPGKVVLRVKHMRRLAHRIGTCDCTIHLMTPPPVANALVASLVRDQRQRRAA